jgi:hypothetical protein
MVDANVEPEKYKLSIAHKILGVIFIVIISALTIYIMIQNYEECPEYPICDLNNSFNTGYSNGYNDGVGYAVNRTAEQILAYSRNCSIVSMNYSNNVFGFIDVTCINNPDAMANLKLLVK